MRTPQLAIVILLLIPLVPGTCGSSQKSSNAQYREIVRQAEHEILTGLNKKVDVDFDNAPLNDVISLIENALPHKVYVDVESISDEGIELNDDIVTFKANGIMLRSVSEHIFTRLDLTWIVHREMLYITSSTHAEELLTTRTYDVSDVITFYRAFDASPTGKKELLPDFDLLIDLIESETSGPWYETGFNPIREFEDIKNQRYGLVIPQHYRVHLEIDAILEDIRRALHSSSDD